MRNNRGKEHTTLTETAALVVRELEKLPGIKMIAPGEIERSNMGGSGTRYITAVYTNAGMKLIITGQSVQKVAVHTIRPAQAIIEDLKTSKRLRDFQFKERERLL